MPKAPKAKYYAVVEFLNNRIYYGTWEQVQKERSRGAKGFDSLDEAAEYCEEEAPKRGGLYHPKHLHIFDLVNDTETTLADKEEADRKAREAASRAVSAAAGAGEGLASLERVATEAAFMAELLARDYKAFENAAGQGAIHLAAMRNFAKAIEWMAKHGFDLNRQADRDRTALHYAAALGHKEAVSTLLAHGANHKLRDNTSSHALAVSLAVSWACEKPRTEEKRKTARAISEMFLEVETGTVSMKLEKNDKGFLIIKELGFDRPSYRISEALAEKFEGGIVKAADSASGYQVKDGACIRHIKSVHSIAEDLKREFVGKPYQAAIRLLCAELEREVPFVISTIDCVELLDKVYSRRCYHLDNLFVGDALENEAYGTLIGQLVKLKAVPELKYPCALPVDLKYQAIFSRHPSYTEFYDKASGRLRIADAAALDRLYTAANIDDPEYATVPVPDFAAPYAHRPFAAGVVAASAGAGAGAGAHVAAVVYNAGVKRGREAAGLAAPTGAADRELPAHLRPLIPVPGLGGF